MTTNISFYKETNFQEHPVIGKIPKDWKVVRLRDVLLSLRNGLTARQNKEGNGYPVTRIETISEERIDPSKLGYVPGLSEKDVEDYRLIEGDILFSHINSLEHIGKTAIYEGVPEFLLHGMNLLVLRPDKNKIHPKFLLYLLRLFRERKIFWAMSKKAVNQASINQTELGNLRIFLPLIEEQQKIAEILSTVDEAIQKTDEIIAKTERLKKGLMQELLTKGLILGFMFDINIFNAILDRHIDLKQLPRNLKYYVTHIQYDEIYSTQDEERRRRLLEIMEKVPSEFIVTEGAAYDVSKYGMAKYMSEADAKQYTEMLRRLKELDEESGRKKSPENQARDILIALTCMKNCLTLVTNDKNLKEVAQEFQCPAITFQQLLKGEYRELKDTEIGKIPREWDVVKLSDKKLAEIIMGQSPPSSTYNEENKGLPFLQGKMEFGEVYPSPIIYCSQPIKIAEQNDILISVRAPVGDVNIAPYRLCIGRGLAAIRFNLERANHWFYFYYFQKIKDFLENLGKGSTFKAITKEDLENLKVPYPPLFEQQRIAEILLNIDKKLEIERKEKAKLERIKQGLMDLLLTGKIRVKV